MLDAGGLEVKKALFSDDPFSLPKEFCGYCWQPKLQESLLFSTKRPFSTGEKLVLYKLVRAVVS